MWHTFLECGPCAIGARLEFSARLEHVWRTSHFLRASKSFGEVLDTTPFVPLI